MSESGVQSSRQCPFCAEDIKSEAIICRYCGSDLQQASANGRRKQHEFHLGRCVHCGKSTTNVNTYRLQCIDETAPSPEAAPAVRPKQSSANRVSAETRRPKRGSTRLRENKKKGFTLGKVVAGAMLIGVLGLLGGFLSSLDEPLQIAKRPEAVAKFWVASDRLNRRTCPSTDCGVVGQFFFREAVQVFERSDGWARVSPYYDASCVNDRSQYVDDGNDRCEPENGIVDGEFAEWASVDFLSEDRPPDPAAGASGAEALIAGSDDFGKYRAAFATAAQALISSGQCSEADFEEMGGWVKSINRRDEPIYFTYCGGPNPADKVYLNAETGEIFQ